MCFHWLHCQRPRQPGCYRFTSSDFLRGRKGLRKQFYESSLVASPNRPEYHLQRPDCQLHLRAGRENALAYACKRAVTDRDRWNRLLRGKKQTHSNTSGRGFGKMSARHRALAWYFSGCRVCINRCYSQPPGAGRVTWLRPVTDQEYRSRHSEPQMKGAILCNLRPVLIYS